jgi:CheY-like chemotaxis protein
VSKALQELSGSASLPASTPVMVCSIPGVEQATSALGVSDYLVKPISRKSLLDALDRLGHEIKTILVVEDDQEAMQLFWRMLASAERGYRMLRAYDGQQALDVLRRERPDAILLDLAMPRMDGFDFLSIKERNRALSDIPTILISARDPLGQPIVSKTLAITLAGGLSVSKLLDCLRSLSTVLWTPVGSPARQGALPG